jgi:hypothetical protein
MANQEHLEILKKGVQEWNKWREQNPGIKPVLKGADLRDADLGCVDFEGADLSGVNFVRAHLESAKFREAILNDAILRKAFLARADLSSAALVRSDLGGAILLRADLSNSVLAGAVLAGAELHGANLTEALLGGTLLGDVDLRSVKGLETVIHHGPSMIGIDTIYSSMGCIPDVFLRGAGVPEEFITHMKSLVANSIESYSCFISYSTKDREFAERLHGDLQNKNVRCWFAPHDVQGGKKLHEQIDEAIRVHEKVLLILSAESMNSEWVKTEIAKARKREVREKKQVLFPVRLVPFEAIRDWECFDADAGKDSAREIREYFIPDFSEWKEHDKYKKAFERLLKDLKAGKRSSG